MLVPLPSHTPFGSGPPLEGDKLKAFWYKTLAHKYKTVVPIFPSVLILQRTLAIAHTDSSLGCSHGGLPWVRLSAQVYLDLDDFEFVGQAVKSVCEAIERGEHLQEVETDLTKAEGDE